jgi:hypothetical protein
MVVLCVNRQSLNISIDRESINNIVVNSCGLGPKTVYYSDHKEALDSLFSMISGEYEYIGNWKRPDTSGGGPYTIALYDHNKDLIDTIYYMDYRIFVGTIWRDKFCTYKHKEKMLDFNEFHIYLDEHVEFR